MSQAFNRKAAYRWYLGHEFWREKCEYVFKRANGKCEKCGKRPPTEVHHLTYIRVFQELPSDLLAVCRQCHAEIHWRQPANDNQIQLVFDNAGGGLSGAPKAARATRSNDNRFTAAGGGGTTQGLTSPWRPQTSRRPPIMRLVTPSSHGRSRSLPGDRRAQPRRSDSTSDRDRPAAS